MKKRIIALFLALITMFSLCACTGGTNNEAEKPATNAEGKPMVTLSVISSQAWPVREDWKLWEYMEEGSGFDIEVKPMINDGESLALMFASGDDIPDLISFQWKTATGKYSHQGALVPFEDVEEFMPNYVAWRDSLSDDDYANIITTRRAADGNIYLSPSMGREATGGKGWLYRKDIFEKHNLKTPTNFEELYKVCKKLKTLYPNSYPFCPNQLLANITTAGSSWQKWWEWLEYYDFENNEWHWGMADPIAKDILLYFKRMIDEGLCPPNAVTLSGNEWDELIVNNRGFIFPNFATRIDYFNSMAKDHIPGFEIDAMVPPVATEQGASMVENRSYDQRGYVLANTKNEARIENAARFLDWLYTDEAMELVSWGKEGETFEVDDNGKRRYIINNNDDQVLSLYGFTTVGGYTRFDPEAALQTESATMANTREMRLEHTLPYSNPYLWVEFTPEENEVYSNYYALCKKYTEEFCTKILLGQEPISKLEEFQKTLREMGVDELLKMYKTAYDRVK